MAALLQMKCIACRADSPPATTDEIHEWLLLLPEWKIIERDGVRQLARTYQLENFAKALALTDRVGEISENEGHHPDILTQWGKVTIWWSTHKIKNLHRNDFIMAAKTDDIAQEESFAS
ncbi:MAG TPA: 4a-hydroxytetrahydrobiopterin dehydratase [Anaerolineae bacterium]|nr:4a-hydroxytetrahydrobiopterin dehydratase [Anaerolineae bacterium]